MSRHERARAALLGLALGDALGAPFEGWPRVTPRQLETWRDAGEPLRWTDDTHMALVLSRRLVDDATLADPEGLGRAFAEAYAREPWRGYGAGPPRVFALVEQGMGFEEAAGSLFDGSGSFGNGAAMRVAPVGLLPAASDLDEAARLASRQAKLTHTHHEAVSGAVVVAEVVAGLLRHDQPDAEAVRHCVAHAVDRVPEGVLRRRSADVLEVLADGGEPWRAVGRRGRGVAAVESVPAALAALLSARDPLGVVTEAVQLGGDTDTIAAMAGAMAGAAWGLAEVPSGLLDRVEARDEIEELATALTTR